MTKSSKRVGLAVVVTALIRSRGHERATIIQRPPEALCVRDYIVMGGIDAQERHADGSSTTLIEGPESDAGGGG